MLPCSRKIVYLPHIWTCVEMLMYSQIIVVSVTKNVQMAIHIYICLIYNNIYFLKYTLVCKYLFCMLLQACQKYHRSFLWFVNFRRSHFEGLACLYLYNEVFNSDRINFSTGSKIFIVGGMTTPSPYCLSSVECFDVATGRWEQHVADLPYRSSGVGCCTLMSS